MKTRKTMAADRGIRMKAPPHVELRCHSIYLLFEYFDSRFRENYVEEI
jgi:hypothetical protein